MARGNTGRWLAVLLAVGAPGLAWGHSVGLEVAAGRAQQPTPADSTSGPQSSTSVSVNLNGAAQLVEDRLELALSLGMLKAEGSVLAWQSTLGLEYSPTDHWNLALSGNYLPKVKNTFQGTASLQFPRLAEPILVPTTYQTQDTSGGLTLSAGYDTFGDSHFETAVERDPT